MLRAQLIVFALVGVAAADPEPKQPKQQDDDLVDVAGVIGDAAIDMRYATADNFTGTQPDRWTSRAEKRPNACPGPLGLCGAATGDGRRRPNHSATAKGPTSVPGGSSASQHLASARPRAVATVRANGPVKPRRRAAIDHGGGIVTGTVAVLLSNVTSWSAELGLSETFS